MNWKAFFLQVLQHFTFKYIFYCVATLAGVVLVVSLAALAIAPLIIYLLIWAFKPESKETKKKRPLSILAQSKAAYEKFATQNN